MTSFEKFQSQLLEESRYIFRKKPMPQAVERAYLARPRHRFIQRYRIWASNRWHEVTDKNLAQHLSTLYSNRSLILVGDDDPAVPSTISQPSLVLYMLDMLQLEPGHRVLEIGAGSGWNAAMIGHMVGPTGRVYSLEIIPELAWQTAETIAAMKVENVEIIEADGGEGYAAAAPYDRVVFTTGAYDLPRHFFHQLRPEGLLLIVIKNVGGGDNLFLLAHKGDHFESIDATPCGFVPMSGKYQVGGLEPILLTQLPGWEELREREVSRRRFWWGGKGQEGFGWRTMGFRSFLGLTEPLFQPFKSNVTAQHPREQRFFGLWEKTQPSLVVAKDDFLIAYGSPVMLDRLMDHIRRWIELGMPSASSMKLRIYPANASLTTGRDEWLIKRREAQFLWQLEG